MASKLEQEIAQKIAFVFRRWAKIEGKIISRHESPELVAMQAQLVKDYERLNYELTEAKDDAKWMG